MNTRRENYKANRIAGMNPYNAAIAAKYSESFARSKVYRLERSEKESIRNALERAGLTEKYQAQELFKLTQATKNQSCDLYVQKDKKGKWTINQNMSQFVEVEDNPTRLKAWEHIAELKKQTSNTIVDQSKHITQQYVVFRNPTALKEEQDAQLQTR